MKQLKYILTLFSMMVLLTNCGTEEIVSETIRPIRYAEVINVASGEGRTFSGVAQSSKETKLSFKVGGKFPSHLNPIADLFSNELINASFQRDAQF